MFVGEKRRKNVNKYKMYNTDRVKMNCVCGRKVCMYDNTCFIRKKTHDYKRIGEDTEIIS